MPVRPQKALEHETAGTDSEEEEEVRNPFKRDIDKEPSEADSMEGIQIPPEDDLEIPPPPEQDEEGRGPRVKKTPKGPTKQEREDHEATHCPYRSWCRHCVRGRARNDQHQVQRQEVDEEEEDRKIPRVAFDYFFLSDEDERAGENPMLVMVDEKSGAKFARAVERKGAIEWLIREIDRELQSWGHNGGANDKLILKSDNESAIIVLLEAVSKYHGGNVRLEHPPRGEKQSNGVVEEAGKTVREYVRVFKDQIEYHIQDKVCVKAVILQWMIRWAAMCITRYSVGTDGKTPYERITGRKCKATVIPLGESIWYKELRTDQKRRRTLMSEWHEGIWLGQARNSTESIVGHKDGVVGAWAIRRKINEEKWSKEKIDEVRGNPAQPNPEKQSSYIPTAIRVDMPDEEEANEVPEAPEDTTRRVYIRPKHLVKYGYTDGCEGCRRAKTGHMVPKVHRTDCRARIEEAMRKDEDDKVLIERADDRRANRRTGEDDANKSSKYHNQRAEEDDKPLDAETTRKEPVPEEQKPEGTPRRRVMRPKSMPGSSRDHEKVRLREAEEDEEEVRKERRGKFGLKQSVLEREAEMKESRMPEEHPGQSPEKKQKGKIQGDKRNRAEIPNEEDPDRDGRRGGVPPEQRESENIPAVKIDFCDDGDGDSMGANPGSTDTINRLQEVYDVEIAEIYSPPRVTTQAKTFGLRAGEAMDIITGWDFRSSAQRKRAWDYIQDQKPLLLIGSPMCTMFSRLQHLRKWTESKEQRWVEAVQHIKFVVQLYREQIRGGRFFIHEHPAGASSWGLRLVQELAREEGVTIAEADQCMYGLKTWGRTRNQLIAAKKPTKFMTNGALIAAELRRKCDGSHEHQQLVGGRGQEAARYPVELCRAMCRGLINEKKRMKKGCTVLLQLNELGPKPILKGPDVEEGHDQEEILKAWDDVSGAELDPKEVMKARAIEIGFVRKKKVWIKIRRDMAIKKKWKIIKTRWIDINKGDKQNPVMRSRLVGKEFNDGADNEMFAATPPLEALRILISEAATVEDGGEGEEKAMMLNDVARAFFEAAVKRDVCIELPDEDLEPGETRDQWVGKLLQSLYGTRDAAANWQEEVAKAMKKMGFTQGIYNPCTYHHKTKKIKTLVHGDDFVSTGPRSQLIWMEAELKKQFEIKTTRVSQHEEDQKEMRVLNRLIRVTDQGWEYEGDQRHADIVIEALSLKEAKGVSRPGETEKEFEKDDDAMLLTSQEATRFRSIAARVNFMATDRSDLQYATKELCRMMATPTKGGWKKLKRVGRYLISQPRGVNIYPWQGTQTGLDGYTDSDWAGCRVTGRSTSGGAIMIGKHFIKSWSRTQKCVTLSSAEAELVAMTKMTAECIGIQHIMREWGRQVQAHVYADSSAALGVADRKGAGKLRHINVGMLWIQEKKNEGSVTFEKVMGTNNPADMMTKYLSAEAISKYSQDLQLQFREGRAKLCLDV